MPEDLKSILNYLKENRGFDSSCYRHALVERQVNHLAQRAGCKSYTEYLKHAKMNHHELDHLIDILTVNVSRFFRNPLTFCYLEEKILPKIFDGKRIVGNRTIRIWSAGCASGEEPYSIAMIVDDRLGKEKSNYELYIFATDVDKKSLNRAQKARYSSESLKNVSFERIHKYFTQEKNEFQLNPEIKQRVTFSEYDLLDEKSYVPSESIYGDFDIVLCRNVLIYFELPFQKKIFEKLIRALSDDGYLILGEVEMPLLEYHQNFKHVNSCCHIYQKKG